MPRLRELQELFYGAITRGHADGADVGALVGEIRDQGPLAAADRIDIYARMYCARLIEALGEDYPRVAAILGPEAFTAAAHRYVEERGSTHPSLRWFGQSFGEFLARSEPDGHPPYIADLARLEWARLEVFDAADADVLQVDDLRQLPAEQWPTLRFAVVPALTVTQVMWPVHRIWDDPESAAEGEPGERWLRVWRRDDQVFQSPMDPAERCALDHVRQGHDFTALCAGLATVVPADEAARTAGELVLRWIEDALLQRPVAAA